MSINNKDEEGEGDGETDAQYTKSEELASLLKPSYENGATSVEPVDRFYFVFIAFLLFGMCSVFPWNVFITAKNYFDYKFGEKNISSVSYANHSKFSGINTTYFENMEEVFFAIGSQVPSLLMQLITATIIHKINLYVRMIISLIGMAFIFTMTAILSRIDSNDWVELFFWITIGCVVCISIFGAVFQSSTFGVAGLFPKKYTQAAMMGQGVGGIIPSLLAIFSIAVIPDATISGCIYFSLAVLCIIITLIAYLLLTKHNFATFYIRRKKDNEPDGEVKTPPFLQIIKQIWLPAILVAYVFMVTLGLFPAVLSQIDSYSPNLTWRDTYFTPVSCFLLFNVFDFIGRSAAVIQIPSENHLGILSFLVFLRTLFFPLFAMCNYQPRKHSHVTFDNDAYPIVFTILFALSNGYLGSLAMMYGPKRAAPEFQETAGAMMAFALVAGLAIGSISSYFVVDLI